jgi:hypothetical protein
MNPQIDPTKLDDFISAKSFSKGSAATSSALSNLSTVIRLPLLEIFELKFGQILEDIPQWVIDQSSALPIAEQQRYMDLIPLLRRNRLQIEQGVSALFDALLHRFGQLGQTGKDGKSPLSEMALADVGLVDTADFDVSVIADGVGTRLAGALQPDLENAFQRMRPLSGKLGNAAQLPFHPRALIQVFLDGLAPLSLSPQQKISLIHRFAGLFDLQTMHGLKQLIMPSVEQAGVPELGKFQPIKSALGADKPKPKKDDAKEAGSGGSGSGGAMPPPTMENGVPVLHTAPNGGMIVDPALLVQQAQHFAQISQSIAAASLAAVNPHPFANEQVIAQTELMQLLNHLQTMQPSKPLEQGEIQASVAEVRDSIRNQLKNDEETTQVIAKDETNLIDLVSTLFDYILDDRELPTPMKALIGRLQIPVLKVALTNKSFFAGEDHPARLLLNLLAKAGMSWDENSKSSEALYNKVEEVVFVVLNDFQDDMRLFERLYEDFNQFYQQQQDRLAAMDARTREAEENRARADTARTGVQQALNRRLNGLKLPMSIVRLLQEGWRHVLYLSALKEGTDSESWKQAIKVVDALIWSMLPPPGDVQWIQRLKDVSPKLMNSLRKGLTSVNFDAHQLEKLLDEIQKSHQEIISGISVQLVEILDPANSANASAVARKEGSSAAVSVEQAINSTSPSDVKFVAMPTAEVPAMYTGETLPSSDRHVIAVRQTAVGTWVEFIQSENVVRHRLVAKIRLSEKLIFANKRGIKSAELSMMQLAIELSQNRASILKDQPQMVDRALISVVDGLKKVTS